MTPSTKKIKAFAESARQRIGELARERLDRESAKGMVLFPKGIHEEAVIEAIIDYLDELIGRLERHRKISRND